MADSRSKGQRAEYAVRDLLRDATGLNWERVPGSGGFGAQHGLKGDIYLPHSTGKMAKWCIEVKHYKDEHFNSNILKTTQTKSQLEKWIAQTERESDEMNAYPMLIFKKDRGQWYVAVPTEYRLAEEMRMIVPHAEIYLSEDQFKYVVADFKEFLEIDSITEYLVK
ncbi:RusA-like Holliday junction resolvase [Vibrio phage D51]